MVIWNEETEFFCGEWEWCEDSERGIVSGI